MCHVSKAEVLQNKVRLPSYSSGSGCSMLVFYRFSTCSMASWWLGWVLLLPFLMVSAKFCEIPETHTRLITSLNLKLLRASVDTSETLNPSIYVGLRLSKEHNLEKEKEYLQRLKLSFQPATSSLNMEHRPQVEAITGRLALYLLSLRASCEDLENGEGRKLITRLKHLLHEEKKRIAETSFPATNYYQYSLGILALCVNKKMVDEHVVMKLLHAEKNKKFSLDGESSVDTDAMAALAFLCLERSRLYGSDLNKKLKTASERLKENILESQKEDGVLGNLYSTALGVQALAASRDSLNDEVGSKACTILMESLKLGHFRNPLTMSQLAPVLHQKTYLDIADMDCIQEADTLILHSGSRTKGLILAEEKISVRLTVTYLTHLGTEYRTEVQVPAGSSLLDVLTMAKTLDPENFSFETKETLSGPYLTTVMGMKHSEGTYWQLVKEPSIPLIKGIADYKPEDGEAFILRLTRSRA
ncbi:transcobalamin-2 isoform X3 [Ambystoma mexicanum]|uniref:transcobalamin-2 isoform X3 n=1 Tax=Ambystoma mexicanum TaxID=8296 RepID=UPI0037E75E34